MVGVSVTVDYSGLVSAMSTLVHVFTVVVYVIVALLLTSVATLVGGAVYVAQRHARNWLSRSGGLRNGIHNATAPKGGGQTRSESVVFALADGTTTSDHARSLGAAAAAGDGSVEVVDDIIGYRGFALANGRLWSCVVDTYWRRGVNRATCSAGHPAPDVECACGIYVVHHLDDAWLRVMAIKVREKGLDFVVGAMALSGAWVDHGEGARFEDAELLALTILWQDFGPSRSEAEQVAAFYGVPLVEPRMLPVVASEFGRPLR
jgi:hypothetical protein